MNLWYNNTCQLKNLEYPRSYTTGTGQLVLKPEEKDGATFEKWILWDYQGNPEDHEAVTKITDELINNGVDV